MAKRLEFVPKKQPPKPAPSKPASGLRLTVTKSWESTKDKPPSAS